MKIVKRKCKECGKTIYGVADSQLDYNMRLHIEKHKKQKGGAK